MPGRTDNEIKNYWNTRVKRRQRAGLPLYPPDLCMHTFKENQQGQSSGAMSCGQFGNHDSLQANPYEIPEVVFDGLKSNSDLYSFVTESPDVGTALMKPMASSPQYYSLAPQTVHRQKRLRESSEVFSGAGGCVQNGYPPDIDQFQNDTCPEMAGSFGGQSYQQDLDPVQVLLSFDATQGVHALQNGNSSASKPTNGAMKLELPSLQYQDSDLSTWGDSSLLPFLESTDAYIQSPMRADAFGSSDSLVPPRNSGLIGDLIHESQHRGSARKHSSEKSNNSSGLTPGDMMNICETEWNGLGVPTSSLGHSVTSFRNEYISPAGSSMDGTPPAETVFGESPSTYNY